jgi:radical SAM/Cys-rich protein
MSCAAFTARIEAITSLARKTSGAANVVSYRDARMNRFAENLTAHGLTLRRGVFQTLQINVGRKCNQACRHCHVDAAPWRTEMMDEATAQRVAAWIREHRPEVVDITGGAPELSEHFCFLVETARECGARVIDRNNLTIIEEAAFDWLPEYLAKQEVEIVASLPCYSPANVNAQRGNGVFEKSISALKKLNAVGYGTRLTLNLVYNPLGAKLPSPQAELEADYKEALALDFGILFNQLYTITNQPIARFAEELRKRGEWDAYLELLANSFNPATLDGVMCRSTLSVGYRGEIYDCDFNQMLGMQLRNGKPLHLWDVTPESLAAFDILTGNHCLACTAGSGSSCTGALK